jgi:hypothetical protein
MQEYNPRNHGYEAGGATIVSIAKLGTYYM